MRGKDNGDLEETQSTYQALPPKLRLRRPPCGHTRVNVVEKLGLEGCLTVGAEGRKTGVLTEA